MLTLFLLIIFFFIIYPLGKALWHGYKLQRKWREATQGMRDAYRRASQGNQNTNPTPRKKKKIDPNVGEYVAFEEVTVETTTTTESSTSSTTYIHTESQIEDAVWEDIK